MESLFTWTEIFLESLKSFGQQIMGAIPGILGAIFLILLGWLIARLIARLIVKLMKVVKFDKLFENLNSKEFLKNLKITVGPSVIVGKFIFWVIFLLFIVTATETLGWTVVATGNYKFDPVYSQPVYWDHYFYHWALYCKFHKVFDYHQF